MKKNNFSVLMSVYINDEASIFYEAVDSVLNNSIKPSEFIIVIDGPIRNDLRDVIKYFSEDPNNNIKILELHRNYGLGRALNKGLKKINNEFVFRADADDFNHRNRFETQIKYLIDGYDIVGSFINEVDKNKKFIAKREVPTSEDSIKRFIKRRSPFNHMTVGYRLSSVINSGLYPENFDKREDYALWAVMISKGARAMNVDDVLVNATTGKEMYKRRGGLKYAVGEFRFQKFLVKIGIKNHIEAVFDFFLRFIAFIIPSFIRGFIYLKWLRK